MSRLVRNASVWSYRMVSSSRGTIRGIERLDLISRQLSRTMASNSAKKNTSSFNNLSFDDNKPGDSKPVKVTCNENNSLCTVLLNRPDKLNSLNLDMVRQLTPYYTEWLKDESPTNMVLIKGSGEKAFCAGGDVAAIQQEITNPELSNPGQSLKTDFFYEEYQLNHKISELYSSAGKLHVAIWNGIVMGGGVGLSVHGKVRICTEKALFAMPETGIGLFPDVGGTYVLSRLHPNKAMGMYIALTGKRLKKDDLLFSHLATHYLPSNKLQNFEEKLHKIGVVKPADLKKVETIHQLIKDLTMEIPASQIFDETKSDLKKHEAHITTCFSKTTLREVFYELDALRISGEDGSHWAAKTIDELNKMSPISLLVTFEAIKVNSGKDITLKEALKVEYRLSQSFMRKQPQSDFTEGIRAVLIDKDQKPKWSHPKIKAVPQKLIDEYFDDLPAQHSRGELQL